MDLRSIVLSHHQSYNDRDLEGLRRLFDEDVQVVVDGSPLHGVAEVLGHVTTIFREFPRLRIHDTRVVAEKGDTIVAEHRILNGDPSGGPLRPQGSVCEIYRVRAGRIIRMDVYYASEGPDREDVVNVPSRAEGSKIAEEQAALRRVATLVARGVSEDELFAAVNEEVGWLVGADPTCLMRFEAGDDTVTLVAAWSAADARFPIGARRPIDDELRSLRDNRRALRFGPTELPADAPFLEEARQFGVRSAVGVPIVVDGRVWGAAIAARISEEPFPEDTTARIAGFTELVATAIANAEGRAGLARLAAEQAALRRVATLVAGGAGQEEVFAAVTEEVGQVLPVDHVTLGRYESDGTVSYPAGWSQTGHPFPPVGTRVMLGGTNLATIVFETGRPARMDSYVDASGPIADAAREMGFRSAVSAPIIVQGGIWGVIGVGLLREHPLPADTEARLADFTEVLATAIANAEARTEVAASRARIVAASDDERRRVVRDLHDGAQQRLVHAIITLKLARRALESEQEAVTTLVDEALDQAEHANVELRELAHGILPAVLTQGGLRVGVDALASRSAVPVEIDVCVDRLPAAVEATAYFIVAEALTNVAKHADATRARVSAALDGGELRLEVSDDGRGGAEASRGTGLVGVADRVAVSGGTMAIVSPPGAGTTISVAIPVQD